MSLSFSTCAGHRSITSIARPVVRARRLLLLPLLIFGLGSPVRAEHYQPRHRILLINSYHHGYAWSDGIETAIRAGLDRADKTVEFSVEYLDTKRFASEQIFPEAEIFLAAKYRHRQPDVLIVSDNPALQFILSRRARLFPGVPVVFCGINGFTDEMIAGQRQITGVVEELDMAGTIDLILRFHPQVRQIAFLGDSSVTGEKHRERFRQASSSLREHVEFTELTDLTLDEFSAALRKLPSGSVILHTNIARDRNGVSLSTEGSIALVRENSPLPFYSMTEHGIGTEGVGGVITSPDLQGEQTVAMALRLLRGESADRMPIVRTTPTRPTFNYPALQRYGISEVLLPAGSVVQGRPPSVFQDYPKATFAAGFGFFLLSGLILALLFNIQGRRQAMRLLRTRKNQLQQIVESLPVGVFLSDRYGRIILGNTAGVKIWGGERNVGIEGYGACKGWHAGSGLPLATEDWGLARAIRNGETTLDELIDIDAFNGQRKTIKTSSLPLRDTDGALNGGLVVLEDVTERLLQEKTLRALVREWQNTFDAVCDAMALLDRDFRVLHCNQAFARLTALEQDAIGGRYCWELVHHSSAPIQVCPYRRMLRSKQRETSEYYLDGRWWETRVDPVFDDDGQLSGAIHFIADITERKRAEQLLAARERTLRLLFREMQSGFALHEIICAADGSPCDYRFLMVNPAFEALTGLSAAGIIGKTMLEIMPEIEAHWIERYGRVALTGESTQFEVFSREFGRYFGVRAYSTEPGKFAVLFNDVTDRVRAEEELNNLLGQIKQRNEELEQFNYTVSHDLKTPLVTINGFVGQLREDLARNDSDCIAADLDFIERSVSQMAVLLDSLLHLARSGRTLDAHCPVDFARTVREALDLAKGVLSGCVVQTDLPAELPLVAGDPERLREVVQNLVVNAAKFSRGCEVSRIAVGVKVEHRYLCCFVRDNGIGIPAEYHERIFRPFEKLDPQCEGTGIGLTIVRRVIEEHGGKIWVESTGNGCGSTFFFTLPS